MTNSFSQGGELKLRACQIKGLPSCTRPVTQPPKPLAKYQSMTDHIATLPKTILLIDYSNF